MTSFVLNAFYRRLYKVLMWIVRHLPAYSIFVPKVFPLKAAMPFVPYKPSVTEAYTVPLARTTPTFKWSNCSRTHSVMPLYYHSPATEQHIRTILNYARQHKQIVRVVGVGHSSSDIAVSPHHMISLHRLDRCLAVDTRSHTVTVQAGMKLRQLNRVLDLYGLALPTLGSISEQTIGGTLSTGTHGTGAADQIIAARVTRLALLDSSGKRRVLTRDVLDGVAFRAALVNIGCLGIVIEVTLLCVDAFDLLEKSESVLNTVIEEDLPSIVGSADYVRIHFFPHTKWGIVTRLSKRPSACKPMADNNRQANNRGIRRLLHFIHFHSVQLVSYHLLQSLYFAALFLPSLIPFINRFYRFLFYRRRRVRRGVSHEMFNFDCLFRQHVIEYAIPFEHTTTVLKELRQAIEMNRLCVHFPIELRFMRADDILLSPCYSSSSSQLFSYINLVMYRSYGFEVEYGVWWAEFQRVMLKYKGRPHWAKSWQLSSATIASLYPEYQAFCAVRREFDPHNIFVNDWAARLFA